MVLILLACTDSKKFEPDPTLHLARYRKRSFQDCLAAWRAALPLAPKQCRAGQMYKGGYWRAATRARVNAAIPSKTLVVSAGLGLVDVQEMVPSYAATFTPSLSDSIPDAGQQDVAERWWRGLGGEERFLREIAAMADPRIICALPEKYLDAVRATLVQFSQVHGAEKLVVLGSRSHAHRSTELGDSWVQLDARMSKHPEIGGAVGQLTARTLNWVLDKVASPSEVNPSHIRGLLEPLQKFDDQPLYPKRQKCSPADVHKWILDAMESADPPSSRSEALRRFRDAGFAFEQKRFGRVYQDVLEELS